MARTIAFREGVARGFVVIWRFGRVSGVFSPRGCCVERGKHRVGLVLRVLHGGFVVVIRRGVPGLGFRPVKATDPSVTFRMRQADPSRSAYERDISGCRIQMATWDPVAFTAEGLLMEQQLDLSSVAARLRGNLVWFVRGSFPIEPVTCEAHPYSFQVRESRRLLTLRRVPSRTIAGQVVADLSILLLLTVTHSVVFEICGQNATGSPVAFRTRQDVGRDGSENAACRAVAFLGTSPEFEVKISKNEEEAPRTPSPHEILSSLASSPRPTTFGNELGSAKRSVCPLMYRTDVAAVAPAIVAVATTAALVVGSSYKGKRRIFVSPEVK
ncbi:hypothetical protein Taro_014571 [Colocasia esculenta]|uniref:Uncharacterized protein n=1 Tax=Colocasia esculenta TaxID=4460 RepID=A0A843UM87_COLES|nr:hypothetical protein [Colocasia esculenta]